MYSKQEVYRLVVNRMDNDGNLSLLTFTVVQAYIRSREIVIAEDNYFKENFLHHHDTKLLVSTMAMP